MNNLQKIRNTFIQSGYNPTTSLRRIQFQNFFNNLSNGDSFTPQVASQIWQKASQDHQYPTVEQLVKTIFDAQVIVQSKIFSLNDQIKIIQEQLRSHLSPQQSRRGSQLRQELQEKQQEKRSFEEDLLLLTEPFGINLLSFMANAAQTRSKAGLGQPQFNSNFNSSKLQQKQIQLKWLFYLCVIFGMIQLIVIYQKYDFLNLMVFTFLMLIFFMNQLDSVYMKFTLLLLFISQILDIIWLFMNSNTYWNLPKEGPYSQAMAGYMKLIIILTFFGIFVKIPLGVFLYHYRNLDPTKEYILDLPCLKMILKPNMTNPITDALKNIEYLQ